MRDFVLYSRTGRTDGNFKSLRNAGRLDIVYQCILMSLYKAHETREDVVFHAILGGSPNPPRHLMIRGSELHDAGIDERSWEKILRKVLGGGEHPGVCVEKGSLQSLIKEKAENKCQIFVLEERGAPVRDFVFENSVVFVLGDYIGLPKKDERFVLRYGKKLSLGKGRYLAASCIDVLNYTLDGV